MERGVHSHGLIWLPRKAAVGSFHFLRPRDGERDQRGLVFSSVVSVSGTPGFEAQLCY